MSSQQIVFLIVNAIGGIAVLGSYAIGLGMFPEYREALWGEVRGTLRTGITISMLFAALGYLAFCYVALFQNGLSDFNKVNWFNQYTVSVLIAIFLISATFWMPTAIAYLNFSNTYWLVVCILSLWVTAISLYFNRNFMRPWRYSVGRGSNVLCLSWYNAKPGPERKRSGHEP